MNQKIKLSELSYLLADKKVLLVCGKSFDDFNRIMNNLGIQYPVSHNKANQLEILTKSVNPVRLKNYPVLLNEDEIKDMYERIIRDES